MKKMCLLLGLVCSSHAFSQGVIRFETGIDGLHIGSGAKSAQEIQSGGVDGDDLMGEDESSDGTDMPISIYGSTGLDWTEKAPNMVDGIKSYVIADFYGSDEIVFSYDGVRRVNEVTWSGYCYRPEYVDRTPELEILNAQTGQWELVVRRGPSDTGIKSYRLSSPVYTDKLRMKCRITKRGYVSEMRIAYTG